MLNCYAESTKKDSKNVKVAIIDSGVDQYNDIFVSKSINLIPGEEEVPDIMCDVAGHGTAVAGIIAATDNEEGITGINTSAEIYSAKVLDGENSAPISRVVDGIYWAIENNVDIINMSFGTDVNSAILRKAIEDANEADILLVAAAGNTGGEVEYPAAYPEVLSVGSVDEKGNMSEDSAVGEDIDVVAPGEQIISSGCFDGVSVCSGTSMAAPHVTAIASIIKQKNPEFTADFIKELIKYSANYNVNSKGNSYGLVDLTAAEKMVCECQKLYETGELETKEHTNKSDIETFNNIDLVEGSWSKDNHESAIVNSSLTTSQISIMKSGVVYPDIASSTKKLGTHPYWHGGYKCSNYVSSYIYATNLSVAAKNGKALSTAATPTGLSSSDRNAMYDAVSNFNWSDLLATPSAKNKSLFLWGMAIHDAMDVYAHSAWGNFSGTWQHLDHTTTDGYKNGLADDTSKNGFPGRYNTAKAVAKKSINTYVAGTNGKASDFNPSNVYSGAGTNWKIKYLYTYLNKHDSTVANAIKSYSMD